MFIYAGSVIAAMNSCVLYKNDSVRICHMKCVNFIRTNLSHDGTCTNFSQCYI